jgi:hypothetical protein
LSLLGRRPLLLGGSAGHGGLLWLLHLRLHLHHLHVDLRVL